MKDRYALDEVINAWTAPVDQRQADDPDGFRLNMHVMDTLLKLLAEGEPVSVTRFANAVEVPLAEARAFFDQHGERGGQLDADGNIVGAALTLILTPHRFIIRGRTLFTWCALDALFIPGLIGQTANVESSCPVTEGDIRLTVSPEGVDDYSPPEAVLSITIPGLSCKTGPDKDKTGPESDTCSQMHFFSSPEAAHSWVQDHPGVAILTVEEAWELVEVHWIKRRKT